MQSDTSPVDVSLVDTTLLNLTARNSDSYHLNGITPDCVFDKVGMDYARLIYVKYGHVRKPTLIKSYVCVFVSLFTKAVHLELVSDLTSLAFLSALRRFLSQPSLIWKDNGTLVPRMN